LAVWLSAVALVLAGAAGAAEASRSGEHRRAARAALERGETDEAQLALRLALQENPLDASSHYLLACLLAQQGEDDLAVVGFQRALVLDPTDPEAQYNLGTLLLGRDMPLEAARLLEGAVLLRSEHVPSYNGLAKAYFMVGLPGLAEATYQEALRRDPSNRVARANLTRLAQAAETDPGEGSAKSPPKPPAPDPALHEPETPGPEPPPKPPGPGAAPLTADGLRELLRDLPDVEVEQRAGRLALTGFTTGAQQRIQLDRILGATPTVLDFTSDDTGDPQRMIEVDAVLFRVVGSDSENIGFNFLRLIDMSFAYFASGNATELIGLAAPGLRPAVAATTLGSNGWIATASVDYDVNIANAADERVAVLSRPHLTTLSGTPASFLAGGEIVFEVSGIETGDIKPYPFGTRLTVTPTLLRGEARDGDPHVHLAVDAERSSILEALIAGDLETDSVVFDKLHVTAEAIVELDETLILSGLNQRASRTIFSGVPILRSIPGLKYFFSSREVVETNTAIMILLTPRDAAFVDERNRRDRAAFVEMRLAYQTARDAGAAALERFRKQYPESYRIPPNQFGSHFFLVRTSEMYRALSGEDLIDDELDLDLLGEVLE
jgi:Tfp pilus assembly protein PilF